MAGLAASSLRGATVHGRPCREQERVARGAAGTVRRLVARKRGRGEWVSRRGGVSAAVISDEGAHAREAREKVGEGPACSSPPCGALGAVRVVWDATADGIDGGRHLHTAAGAVLVAARLRAGQWRG
jgi:hypothetical protein